MAYQPTLLSQDAYIKDSQEFFGSFTDFIARKSKELTAKLEQNK
jgi:hypothetical protein